MNSLDPKNWVKFYADDLLKYAMFRLNDVNTCEDLVQETFLSALKSKDTFKGESNEKTWLISILKNKIIDTYRKNAKFKVDSEGIEPSFEDEYFESQEGSYGPWKANQFPQDSAKSALDKLLHHEYVQTLRMCLSRLNEFQRSILQEKYFEENPSDKICKENGLSKSNYWVTMHRINLQLRKCMELNWFTE